MVDVLIDNVFAHTPDSTPFSVSVRRVGADLVLTVSDHGPGRTEQGGQERPGTTGLPGRSLRPSGPRRSFVSPTW